MEKIKVLYIAGAGRSGSTLLERLLGQSDQLLDVGELRFFWDRGLRNNQLCGCGQPVQECPRWRQVIAAMPKEATDCDLDAVVDAERRLGRLRGFFRLHAERNRSSVTMFLREHVVPLYVALGKVADGRMLIDASKSPSYLYILSLCDEIDLKVVHIFRDGRAVAYSNKRKKRKLEIEDSEVYMAQFSSLWSSAAWAASNVEIVSLKRRLGPERYILVRYEELAKDPQRIVRDVLEFAGIEPRLSFFVGENEVELAPTHTVAGNPMRFKTGVLTIRLDEEWRREMSVGDWLIATMLMVPFYFLTRRKSSS